MHSLPLTGLYASNPLGALAAFGLLRVFSEIDTYEGAKLSWRETDDWQAVLHTGGMVSRQELTVALAERQNTLDLSPYSWSEDIRVETTDFRERLRKYATDSTGSGRTYADIFSGYGSELAIDGAKRLVKPTALHMTSGQQEFLKGLKQLGEGLRYGGESAFEEALFGPWRYEDKQHSMGWDPNTERMAALRHVAPTKEKAQSVRAAVWLAAEALPLFPTAAVESLRGVRLETTGFSRRNGEWRFRWPVWREAIGLSTLKSLLAAPWLQDERFDKFSLSRRGVCAIFQSVQTRFGQGYGIFRPATPVFRAP